MSKRKIIIIICIFFAVIENIKADTYNCTYETNIAKDGISGGEKQITLSFDIDPSSKTVSKKKSWGVTISETFMDPQIDSTMTEAKLIEKMNGGCFDRVFLCELKQIVNPGSSYITTHAVILNPDIYYNVLPTEDKYLTLIMANILYGYNKYKDCGVANLNKDKSTGKIVKSNFECSIVSKKIDEIKNNRCYPNNECSSVDMEKYNVAKASLKEFCKVNFKYAIASIDPCINDCLNLNLALGDDSLLGECGLSQKMIIWIANIIRWVKYIVPVAAIVLGILDFMKAISADKEDEMKKAQQRFIRKLIAAALIFIIPFIIEFILVKFGFDSNGCGIINL